MLILLFGWLENSIIGEWYVDYGLRIQTSFIIGLLVIK